MQVKDFNTLLNIIPETGRMTYVPFFTNFDSTYKHIVYGYLSNSIDQYKSV